jgi:hypothetical protein
MPALDLEEGKTAVPAATFVDAPGAERLFVQSYGAIRKANALEPRVPEGRPTELPSTGRTTASG